MHFGTFGFSLFCLWILFNSIGKTRKVRVTQADTFIGGPEGNPQHIKNRIDEIKVSISQTSNERTLMILKVLT